ncbi:MAG: glycosyltransferase family 4 protein [Verrucomicrobiota bacterium JB022]|nr:glycosyltransferase family 4 protein [Verrucomicrobiota bacterium JB022]
MKILFTFAISDFTGASRMGLSYVKALRDAGHEVICVSQEPPKEGESIVPRLRAEGFEVLHLGNFLTVANPLLVWRLAVLMRQRGVQLASSMNQGDVKTTAWAALLARVPYAPQVQNLRMFGAGVGGRIKGALYGLSMWASTDLAIASSGATEAETIRRFDVPAENVVCVHNAIDPSQLSTFEPGAREALRAELGLEPHHFAFTCVGRLGEQKGQLVLLEAWAHFVRRFPHARLLLVGDAGSGMAAEEAYKARLLKMAEELELHDSVHFLGWRNDVAALHHASDGYVHPAMWEGFPLAVLEAFGAGLPVIMSDCVGRPRGFVDDVHGYLVPKGEPAPLAAAMARLLEKNGAERAAMGEACRALLSQEFDIRRNARRLARCMELAAQG